MNKLILLRSLLFSFLTVCLVACSDDEDEFYTGTDVGVQVFDSQVYRPADLTEAFSRSGMLTDNGVEEAWQQQLLRGTFDALLADRIHDLDRYYHQVHQESGYLSLRQWQVESYCFKYKTVSAAGEPIMLSGRVTFPAMKNGSELLMNSLTLHIHYYMNHLLEAPTASLSPAVLRVFFNSAIIEPDLEGYGVTGDRIPCGIAFKQQACQNIDCVWAALQVMKSRGVKLMHGGHTTLWGLSLGAPLAIATAQYCEEQLTQQQQEAINLTSVLVDSGPYLLGRILDFWDKNPSVNASLICRLLMFIHGFNKEYLEGYDPKDFCAEWMHTYQVNFKGKDCSLYEAIRDCGGDEDVFDLWPEAMPNNKVSNCLASDMLLPDGRLNRENPKTQAFINILTKCSDVGTWLPKASVYISHGTEDNYIPFEQAQAFYEQIKGGKHVEFKAATGGLMERVMGVHQGCTLNVLIAMILFEEPADAHKNLP